MSYLPIPARVWSRVQNECSVNTSSSNLVYDQLTGQYLTQEEYNKLKQIQIKGNILQYKNNSSNLTKKQKYSKIAKGQWTNRTKTWATQSLTYSNPNTTSLQRVNTSTLAATANTPFVTNIYSIPTNSFNCPINVSGGIVDGGNLVGTVTVNPCTNDIIKVTSITNCNLSTDCDVPGPPIALCWNPKLPTYYPRQNLTNNNSTDKWPVNYKGLVSALKPFPPVLILDNVIDNTVYLSWTYDNKSCIPITAFNLYQNINGTITLINIIPFPITSTQVYNLLNCTEYIFYVTALSTNVESQKSNEVSTFIRVLYGTTITSINPICNNNNGVEITWSAPDISCINITAYYIYQDGIKTYTVLPNTLNISIINLSTCTDYDFNVSYFDSISNKESYLSNTAIFTEHPCPPTITAINFDPDNNQEVINFSPPTATCTISSFILYQTIDPSNNYTLLVTNTPPYSFTLSDSVLQNSSILSGEHTFYMKTYSNSNSKESDASNSYSIPPPPYDLSGNLTSNPGEVYIHWTNQNPSTGLVITEKNIYIKKAGGSNYSINLLDPTNSISNYTLTGLQPGSKYYIYVTSYVSSNSTESVFSNRLDIDLPPIITFDGSGYNNTYTSIGGNYGIVIYDTPSSYTATFTFNYPSYSVNVFAIGGGGNGGWGGGQEVAATNYGGGGGGGGGGNSNSTNFNTTSLFNIIVGGANTDSSVNGMFLTGTAGQNGSDGGKGGSSSAGSGGQGGSGNGGGGRGSEGGFSNNGEDGGGVSTSYNFTINSNNYTFNYGGGGGGGSQIGSSAYNGGNPNGADGGYDDAPNGGAPSGQNANYTYQFINNNNVFNLAGGGGGGSGATAIGSQGSDKGSSGGSGAQGIVVFYWDFT